MNLRLDQFIRDVVRSRNLLDDARQAPAEIADLAGLPVADVNSLLRGDLLALYWRGAHSLLLMQLAAVLGVDPREQMSRHATALDPDPAR